MNEYIARMVPQDDKIFTVQLCGVTYPDTSYKIERRNSAIYVLEYIKSGEGIVVAGGREYRVCEGDIYFLKAGENHLYYSDADNPWTKIWVNITGSIISELVSVYGFENTTVVKNLDISDKMNQMLEICDRCENVNMQCELIFHEIMRMMYNHIRSDVDKPSAEAQTIKEFINSNIASDISVKELSKKIFRSEAQTIRIFKAAYKMTPYEYILSSRIKNAKLLLCNTNLFVKEIAHSTGFLDEHYFANIFKKKTGFSPKEYRKKYK